jgi:hypothetical protein
VPPQHFVQDSEGFEEAGANVSVTRSPVSSGIPIRSIFEIPNQIELALGAQQRVAQGSRRSGDEVETSPAGRNDRADLMVTPTPCRASG